MKSTEGLCWVKIMDRVQTLERLKSRYLNQTEAALELNISVRQVRRLFQSYLKGGAINLISKKKIGRTPYLQKIKNHAIGLIKTNYIDFGPTLAAEKLFEVHKIKISRETLRNWMAEEGLWVERKRKRATYHQSRSRRNRFGELVQMDGSHHDWFEGRADKCCLLVMVDDATSQIIAMRFEPSETTEGYFKLMHQHFQQEGRPLAYYTDKHSTFKTTRNDCKDGRMKPTQIHRALNELGIELICANSPQAKGRVERANSTLQDRFIKELRIKNISSITEANQYLEVYRKDYNKRFGKLAKSPLNAHRSIEGINLETILGNRHTRTLSKNLELSLDSKRYQIKSQENGYRLRKAKVDIHETVNGIIYISYKGKNLDYKVFSDSLEPKVVDRKNLDLVLNKLIKQNIKDNFSSSEPPVFLAPQRGAASLTTNADGG